ncbi:MAG: penicillin-binding protein [Flavobacteriaceae bacterium]|nr:penicillin-binding protein [Flavobacteriaceae bacterium]|tara:strand:+ start:42204 stop:44483 length:2280 start_codon:yes stop_codon:yes gene_type:complete
MWCGFLSPIIIISLLFYFASIGGFGEMPDIEVLENPKTNLASEIFSSDYKTLGKFYFNDNRTPVKFEDLPAHLINALIATEDIRFFSHSGIDFKSTLRAIIKLGSDGGGSTITQQLAKQLFTGEGSKNIFERISQKFKEYIISIRLESQFTKNEIISQYLNIYDFNNNADGIRSAARIYFGKEPIDLDINESAMLVGMLKNSSLYNPRPNRNPRGVKNRRNVVLAQMSKYGYINRSLADSLKLQPLNLNYTPESHREGLATYFREYLRAYMKSWIESEDNRKPDGSKYNLNTDGLKIYTTINYSMQEMAELAVKEHMPRLQEEFFRQNKSLNKSIAPFRDLTKNEAKKILKQSMKRSERWRKMKYDLNIDEIQIEQSFYKPTKMTIFSWKGEIDTVMTPIDSMKYYKSFLRPGMMSMDPLNGHIKAWVGGMNYKHFQYDMVKLGKRQIGSTFKPFVYAAAINQLKVSPCDTFPDSRFCIEKNKYGNLKEWCPKNSGGIYGKTRTLKNSLANSVNTISARLIDRIGPITVIKLVNNLGIEQDINPLPSIALGTPDISVYEMVAAYSAFANKGVYTKPVFIERIEDKNGTVLFEYQPITKDVLSEEAAYVTVNLLEGVTKSGSGIRLRTNYSANNPVFKKIITGYPYEFTNPIAGKTGTTQNQSDGWFIGMVPNLVTGVWVGAEDRSVHFNNIAYGQGASMALPIWGVYMKSIYNDSTLMISKESFERPKKLGIDLDCYDFRLNNLGEKVVSPGDLSDIDF